MNSRTKMVHLPGPDEAGLERHEWAARCGWPYGLRQFFRLSAEPRNPAMPAVFPGSGPRRGRGGRLLRRRLLLLFLWGGLDVGQ